MNGLDLLLSFSPNSETVHQVTLACLLKDRAIARSLGLTGTPKNTSIETNGRLFDITVEMEEGSVSHVELKINATLGDEQVERQRSFVETSQDEMIYILLGTQQFMTPAQMRLKHWEGAGKQEISFSADGVITLGPKERFYETSPKILNLDGLIDALSQAAFDTDQKSIQELAIAYRSCLESMRQTFTSFVTTPVASWNDSSWIGFYELLRASNVSSSGWLDSRIGVPQFRFDSHPLSRHQLAVDDFIVEYDVHLVARRGEFRFKMSAIGDYDAEEATHVRKRFSNLLVGCAEKHGLPLQLRTKRIGRRMIVATLAVSELYQADMQAFGWEQCMTAVQSAASAISDAAAAYRSSRA